MKPTRNHIEYNAQDGHKWVVNIDLVNMRDGSITFQFATNIKAALLSADIFPNKVYCRDCGITGEKYIGQVQIGLVNGSQEAVLP